MKYNKLGKSDLNISEISFGCMSLDDDQAANTRLLHYALDHGINYFDTADIYQRGLNEITIGKAFKDRRDQVIIATKAGNQLRADGKGWDWNPSKAYLLKSADESLSRLQTDYIDLYQLHGGTINDPIDETIEAFELLKAQGKIRYYGISSIRPNVIREYIKRSNIVSVMMQYSLLDRRPEESCLDLLHKNHIGVVARGSVAKGMLVNKPAEAFLDHSSEAIEQAVAAVKTITGNRSASDTAIRYVLHHPAIASAVVGIRTQEQLDDVVLISKTSPLEEHIIKKISSSIRQNFYTEHR